MKNLFLTTVLLFAFTALSFGQSVVGTKHDLAAAYYLAPINNGVCGSCHTPHNAVSTLVPLWSHATTAAVFQMYSIANSSTYQATNDASPSGASLACLSCHDGTIALDNFIGGDTTATFITGSSLLSTDLRNDHPISFLYDAALVTADGGLANPAVAPVLPLLFSGKMQCASCHDVHNNVNAPFMRMTNVNSELCLTCHLK